jgi:SHS2 domain-containing protein
MTKPTVRVDPHAAELGVTISADSPDEVFAEAARWLARRVGTGAASGGDWQSIHLEAPDPAALLVDWLNELIGRSEIEQAAFHDVRNLRISGGRLDAEIRGQPVSVFHLPVKAATLHGVRLVHDRGRWRGDVLLDV